MTAVDRLRAAAQEVVDDVTYTPPEDVDVVKCAIASAVLALLDDIEFDREKGIARIGAGLATRLVIAADLLPDTDGKV